MNRRPDLDPRTLSSTGAPMSPGLVPLPRPLDATAWASLAVWVLATVTVGTAVGVVFAPDGWFAALAKPTWYPPSWVFAPAWLLLYALLGVSAWLVQRQPVADPAEKRVAWLAFAVQAALNLAWSPVFFGLHAPGAAFAVICGLWAAVLWTTMRFGRLRPLAGYLLAPYMLWVSYALVLNGTVWLMNE